MKESLVKTEIDFKQLFESLPALFLILRPDAPHYTILGVNDSFLTATKTRRKEILDCGLFDIFPQNSDSSATDGINSLSRSLEKVIKKKKVDVMSAQRYDLPKPGAKDGSLEERHWSPRNIPILDDKGDIRYIIHQVDDMTGIVLSEKQRKEENRIASEEIRKKSFLIKENEDRINRILNALLKYTVLDFSEELSVSDKGDELDAIAMGLNTLIVELKDHVEKLAQSYDDLEYVNKELEAFSYSVSHDLRAPLRAIDGYSRMVLEDHGTDLNEDAKQCLDTIIRNAGRMGNLIDDLLTFSRLGKQSLTTVQLNLTSITESVVSELKSLWPSETMEVNIHPLCPVQGDSSMLRQVMTNLVSNAMKYSHKKGQQLIEIGCREEKTRVVFYVKDNGAGFDMKYYDKLFGVFQRLHGKNEFEGTGVGLALVKRIITKHGGEVWGEGKPEEGATFYFSLPKTTPATEKKTNKH